MVIVRITGGLGNQLFQYATARRIAEYTHSSLKLDISFYKEQNLRNYELNHFNVIEEFALPNEIIHLKKGGYTNKILNHMRKTPRVPESFIKEERHIFNPAILELSTSVYLDGYWQNEKYFYDIQPIIQKEFTIKNKPDKINKAMAERITASNSVSVHIRRTDYVSDVNSSQVLETCSLNYYQKAIEEIIRKVKQPNFFVFSDDIPWAKQNLKIDFPVIFIDHNGPAKAYEDIRLMSLCKHHIIANSTFSWWGVWLSQNPAKLVYAPQKWFKVKELQMVNPVPENWIQI